MDRRVTPPKRVTSPTWGPPPPCKQALNAHWNSGAVENACSYDYLSALAVPYLMFVGACVSHSNIRNYEIFDAKRLTVFFFF